MTDTIIYLQYGPVYLNWNKRKNTVKHRKLGKKEKAEDSKTEPVGFLEDNYFKPGCMTWHHLEDC